MADPRAQGCDISKWQNIFKRAEKPPRPLDFVIQRLSYGLTQDERYTQFLPVVQSFPVYGAYHYYSSNIPWQTQAEFFIDRLRGHQFFAWDVEKMYNYPSTAWLDGIEQAMDYIIEQTKIPGMIYTGPDVWDTWLVPVRARLVRFELWQAQYWFTRALTQPGMAKTQREDWRFWQYDDRAMWGRGYEFGFGSKGGDLDVFNGTVAQLQAWANSTPLPPPPPPATGGYRVTAGTLKVFVGPDSNLKQLPGMVRGQYVTVNQIVTNLGEQWAHLATGGWCRFAYLERI
jgi:hypothetical protein